MAIRSNHYDVAFEEFLRSRRAAHVVVDEQRRALLSDATLKSMDFIVYSENSANLLVDVKGRRFPSGGEGGNHKWENWATADDLDSLSRWEGVFGDGFRSGGRREDHALERLHALFDISERSRARRSRCSRIRTR